MEIRQIFEDKKRFLPLLLLGDEQESMIDRYLDGGELFVLLDGETPLGVCVTVFPGPGTVEIKNLAIAPEHQRRGLGRTLVEFVRRRCEGDCHTLLVGTGDSPLTLPFYEKCGFRECGRIKNFFTEHYDHPIFEGGRQLRDMIYLRLSLKGAETEWKP